MEWEVAVVASTDKPGDHLVVIRAVDGITDAVLAGRIARGAARALHHNGHPVNPAAIDQVKEN